MAKITSLAELTDVASDDLLVVVDKSDTSMSDSGTDKKVQKNNLLKGLTVDNLATGVLDTDLSSVSGNHDTLASAKAIKAYSDAGKVGASYNGFSGGDITTTSTSPVQVGSAKFSITTKGGNLFVSASALMKVNTLTGRLGIQIDGTTVVECFTNSTSYISLCPQYVKTSLSAGSHTIKLVFSVQSGSTATIPAYNTYFLSAVEL